jgi:hypothetical protein
MAKDDLKCSFAGFVTSFSLETVSRMLGRRAPFTTIGALPLFSRRRKLNFFDQLNDFAGF